MPTFDFRHPRCPTLDCIAVLSIRTGQLGLQWLDLMNNNKNSTAAETDAQCCICLSLPISEQCCLELSGRILHAGLQVSTCSGYELCHPG